MANILFFTDVDESHILPTIGLARSLKTAGHEVRYLGIRDVEPVVEAYGFGFIPVFEGVYPRGFLANYKRMQREQRHLFANGKAFPRPHLPAILGGELDSALDTFKPDLMILNYALPIEARLVQSRYAIPLLFFSSWLRRPELKASVRCREIIENLPEPARLAILAYLKCEGGPLEASAPLDEVPEVIPCPKAFELPGVSYDTQVFHIESASRNEKTSDEFVRGLAIPAGKRVLYASFGSQTALFTEAATRFFATLIRMMSSPAAAEWHLVLSIGKEIDPLALPATPANVSIHAWVPQPAVLEIADLAITHGGLGTIRECIANGVPMIAFPIMNDGPDNAKRVEFHRLGRAASLADANEAEMIELIREVLASEAIREGVEEMRRAFAEIERASPGVDYVSRLARESAVRQ